jgi:DnaJ like chaperone protein
MKTGRHWEESQMARYYRLLGCAHTDGNETIKRRYHEIVKRIHPDMLFQQGLPDSVMRAKTEEFQKIQEAYDKIMETRKHPA